MPLGNKPASVSYTVSEATNGFIFSWYDITTDKETYSVAATPEELASIIRAWHEERLTRMVEHQNSRPKLRPLAMG